MTLVAYVTCPHKSDLPSSEDDIRIIFRKEIEEYDLHQLMDYSVEPVYDKSLEQFCPNPIKPPQPGKYKVIANIN